MLALLISILIQLGIITNAQGFDNLTPDQQEKYKKEIIIDDDLISARSK